MNGILQGIINGILQLISLRWLWLGRSDDTQQDRDLELPTRIVQGYTIKTFRYSAVADEMYIHNSPPEAIWGRGIFETIMSKKNYFDFRCNIHFISMEVVR